MTGSSGLIGSEAVEYYDRKGETVYGVDGNMRREFLGPEGDSTGNLRRLQDVTRHFTPIDLDTRWREGVFVPWGLRTEAGGWYEIKADASRVLI